MYDGRPMMRIVCESHASAKRNVGRDPERSVGLRGRRSARWQRCSPNGCTLTARARSVQPRSHRSWSSPGAYGCGRAAAQTLGGVRPALAHAPSAISITCADRWKLLDCSRRSNLDRWRPDRWIRPNSCNEVLDALDRGFSAIGGWLAPSRCDEGPLSRSVCLHERGDYSSLRVRPARAPGNSLTYISVMNVAIWRCRSWASIWCSFTA